jgi:DNA-binding NtrC family response regulator
MSGAQPRPSALDAAKPATMWVVNSDAHVRCVVEKVVQNRLRPTVSLIFSEDLSLPVAIPLPDIVLINLNGSAESCFNLLAKIHRVCPKAKVIFLSNVNDLHLWIEAIQLGAYDFLPKSIDADQLGWVLQGALVSP